jgi:hypothetical protein
MFKKLRLSKEAPGFLFLLLITDAFFLALHVANRISRLTGILPIFRQDPFDVSYDLGMGETFQYIKEFWVILFFVWLIVRYRQWIYSGWTLLFSFLLLDDMLSVHEHAAKALVHALGYAEQAEIFLHLRYKDVGELMVAMTAGIFFLLILGSGYLKSDVSARRDLQRLFGLCVLLAFFGVAFDVIGRLAENIVFQALTTFLEDGGEMITMSLICWFVYGLTQEVSIAQLQGAHK